MPIINLIVRCIVGGIVGWIIGTLLTRVTLAYDNYRLNRMKKRTDKALNNAFAPIFEMDRRQF